jgi:hypothetical protein
MPTRRRSPSGAEIKQVVFDVAPDLSEEDAQALHEHAAQALAAHAASA